MYKEMADQKKRIGFITGILIVIILGITWFYILIMDPLQHGRLGIITGTLVAIFFAPFLYKYLQKKIASQQILSAQQTISPISVVCPYCNNTFQIPQQEKPFKAKCPKCGKVSLLR